MSVHINDHRYTTAGGLVVERWVEPIPDGSGAIEPIVDALDTHRGALFTSTFEYPGRYTRWDMGFVDPALEVRAQSRSVSVLARSRRGDVLLAAIKSLVPALYDSGMVLSHRDEPRELHISINAPTQHFVEEQRSRQPSVFSLLRAIVTLFQSDDDPHLGLYGAFGYDLAFQFDPLTPHLARDGSQRDLVLFVPDELVIVDHKREFAARLRYDFTWKAMSTTPFPREPGETFPYTPRPEVGRSGDHGPGGYAEVVAQAKEYFARGDLFEVTPSQVFSEGTVAPPSEIFRRLRARNPAPYGALMNLGEGEFLVSASPEMYVRVEGTRVETCPIAGTIPRGKDVLEDADRIRELLDSRKDESELTMCTDVDRNDKSRICDPSTIKVIGRRQIEMYSRLIHTVDHVEATLLPDYDALDAFLSHTWAVTVTGAPKLWSMRFIEEHEASPRAWYGGAIGALLFNGNINTGLTLRTIHIRDGIASVRAGATLLIDSDPAAEEAETVTKASALLDAIRRPDSEPLPTVAMTSTVGVGRRVLLVDHEDSFVHTLAGYIRRTGAEVTTVRVGIGEKLDPAVFASVKPDLLVLSPGPGRPDDFALQHSLQLAADNHVAVFGVCLGLQGMVEFFGGTLGQLSYPMHGKASEISVKPGRLFAGLPDRITVGRYHSLYGETASLPPELLVTALSDDGVVMALEHETLPFVGVQFHPESIMTLRGNAGMQIVENVLSTLK